MSGSRETISIMKKLLHQNSAGTADIKALHLSELCKSLGLAKVTTQWLSRTLQKNSIDRDVETELRPILLGLEELIERAYPLRLSFADPSHTKFLLTLLNLKKRVEKQSGEVAVDQNQ